MLYEALQDGSVHRDTLLDLYLSQLPRGCRPIFAGDHTACLPSGRQAWSRLHAPTLAERTVEHQPNGILGAMPITVGQGYATLAWLPDEPGKLDVAVLARTDRPDRESHQQGDPSIASGLSTGADPSASPIRRRMGLCAHREPECRSSV